MAHNEDMLNDVSAGLNSSPLRDVQAPDLLARVEFSHPRSFAAALLSEPSQSLEFPNNSYFEEFCLGGVAEMCGIFDRHERAQNPPLERAFESARHPSLVESLPGVVRIASEVKISQGESVQLENFPPLTAA